MGKGDRKTARGKRNIRSYGKSRPHHAAKAVVAAAPAKKTAARKKA